MQHHRHVCLTLLSRLLLAAGLLCVIPTALADTFNGKIDLIEAKSDGTRFFVRDPGLHLYATAHYREVLIQAYFHKAVANIGYQTFPCPGGMSGKCGTVYSVSVEQANF